MLDPSKLKLLTLGKKTRPNGGTEHGDKGKERTSSSFLYMQRVVYQSTVSCVKNVDMLPILIHNDRSIWRNPKMKKSLRNPSRGLRIRQQSI